MMRLCAIVIALLLAGGCERMATPQTDQAKRAAPRESPIRTLTEVNGLYRSTDPDGHLCILDGRFGLASQQGEEGHCGGSGQAQRNGDAVRFVFEGDSACRFDAAISGGALVFPASLPSGCAYYCSPGATLRGSRLTQIGAGTAQARKARDPVGDPLCGE